MKKFLIRIFPLIFLSTMLDICHADNITVQGEVSGQWDADTVFVAGDITVSDGQSLAIQPGTRVIFTGSYFFNVGGSIQASGSGNDSIWFTIADTAGFIIDTIPDGGWKGIRFDSNRTTNPTSVFYRCNFSFGKNADADPLKGNGGALSVKAYDKVRVEQCLFTDNFAIYNGGAIALDSSDISITSSVFKRNRAGLAVAPWGYGGAVSSDNSNPEIRWNVFTDNSSTGVGGGLSVRYKDCNIYNNVFTENTSGLGGALCMGHIPETVHRVNNNLLADNYAVYFGGGVATLEANPVYINNTIVNNTAMYGGGFYCNDSVSPDFYNTIFWGNQAGVGPTGYLFEVLSQADFYNCVVEYGPAAFGGSGGGVTFAGAYENCIELDPEFSFHGDFPFQPDPDSPCIDAGTADTSGFFLPEYDLANLPRFWGGNIDMGAYELVYEGVKERAYDPNIRVFPNPYIDHFTIEFDLLKDDKVLIEVFDMGGHCIKSMERNCPTGENLQITMDMGGLLFENEALLLVFSYGKGQFSRKIIHKVTQRSTK